jgi:hypothetical protein
MIEVRSPANQFFDTDGTPLDNGYIYVGISGANPETSAQTVYWDKAGTIPAAQPIRTLNGYPARDGAVSKFYTSTKNYSITIKDKRGILVLSSLNTDSGIFDEIEQITGAAGIGYDNSVSELVGDNVQEAIDELKSITDAQDVVINSSLYGFNLFPNSAFLLNSKTYASGDPTTAPNEETLDNIYVITTGEFITYGVATFGNFIIAPAGGAVVTIDGASITGGQYACKWEGSGTILVNGVFYEKTSPFTLTANLDAVITLTGQFSNFQFTRPNMLGLYEYDNQEEAQKGLWRDGAGWFPLPSGTTAERAGIEKAGYARVNSTLDQLEFHNGTDIVTTREYQAARTATTSGTSFDFNDIPAWATSLTLSLNGVSLSSTGSLLIQLGGATNFVTTGYSSTSLRISTGATAASTDTTGFVLSLGVAANAWTGIVNIKKFTGGTRTFVSSHTGITSSSVCSYGGGKVDMTEELTRIRVTRVGSDTFDAGEIVLHWS